MSLFFTTRDDAEACRKHLIERLPGSDELWFIVEEVSPTEKER